jgi:predicted phage tail component-like protein
MTLGVTFDGKHSSDIQGVYGVLSYNFPISPQKRNRSTIIDGRHGAIDQGYDYDPRVFPIRFLFRENSITEYFQALFLFEQWLHVEEVKPFIFDAIPDKMLMCRPTGIIEPDRRASFSYIDVEFTAFDPFFTNIQSRTVTGIASGVKFAYEGSKETRPLLDIEIITGAQTFSVTEVNSGKKILLNRSVVAGDLIHVDNKNRIFTLNGVDAREYLAPSSRWLVIKPPEFHLTFSSSAIGDITYYARW